MVVSKKKFIFIFVWLCINIVYAEVPHTNKYIETYVEKKLKSSLVKWGDKVKTCQKREELNSLHFDPNMLKDLNISLNEFKIATIVLNYNNFNRCVKDEQNDFIYQSLLVYRIKQRFKEVGTDALNFSLISLPSNEVLEAMIKYELLLPKVKLFFKKHIGLEPFNIVKVSIPIYQYFRK